MEKYLSSIFAVTLFLCVCLFTTHKGYSQIKQEETVGSTENSQDAPVKGITPMRARTLVAGLFGLISLAIGWKARTRASKGIGNGGRNGAMVSLTLGGIAIVFSIIHLAITSGAVFGSGSGKAGAIVALGVGLVGVYLSGKVLIQKKEAHQI